MNIQTILAIILSSALFSWICYRIYAFLESIYNKDPEQEERDALGYTDKKIIIKFNPKGNFWYRKYIESKSTSKSDDNNKASEDENKEAGI